jgi:hypothetical protein
MTYSPNIPQGSDTVANSATPIRTDFSQFAAIFGSNHTPLNNSKQGNHGTIIFERQPGNPDVTNNFFSLYNKNAISNVGTQPQLFMRIPVFLPTKLDPNSPGNPAMQLTYSTVNLIGPIYQSFLAGKYLIYFGTKMITSPAIFTTITVSPAPTKILMAIANPNTTNSGVAWQTSTNIISNTQFQIFVQSFVGSPIPFTWVAIATA